MSPSILERPAPCVGTRESAVDSSEEQVRVLIRIKAWGILHSRVATSAVETVDVARPVFAISLGDIRRSSVLVENGLPHFAGILIVNLFAAL